MEASLHPAAERSTPSAAVNCSCSSRRACRERARPDPCSAKQCRFTSDHRGRFITHGTKQRHPKKSSWTASLFTVNDAHQLLQCAAPNKKNTSKMPKYSHCDNQNTGAAPQWVFWCKKFVGVHGILVNAQPLQLIAIDWPGRWSARAHSLTHTRWRTRTAPTPQPPTTRWDQGRSPDPIVQEKKNHNKGLWRSNTCEPVFDSNGHQSDELDSHALVKLVGSEHKASHRRNVVILVGVCDNNTAWPQQSPRAPCALHICTCDGKLCIAYSLVQCATHRNDVKVPRLLWLGNGSTVMRRAKWM